jgi:hypothetical protein
MLLNVGALSCFAINAYLQYGQWNEPHPAYRAAIALAAAGMGFVLAAGFLGWKMVQDHHVGVNMSGEEERSFTSSKPRPTGTREPAVRRV